MESLAIVYLGHMCPNSGQEPIECPMGFFSVGNTTTCLTCPAGYACLSTDTIPVACSHGYYSLEGITNCTQCEAGYFCEDSKSPPRSCDPGTYVSFMTVPLLWIVKFCVYLYGELCLHVHFV